MGALGRATDGNGRVYVFQKEFLWNKKFQAEYKACLKAYTESFAVMSSYLLEHYSEDGAYWRLLSLVLQNL